MKTQSGPTLIPEYYTCQNCMYLKQKTDSRGDSHNYCEAEKSPVYIGFSESKTPSWCPFL